MAVDPAPRTLPDYAVQQIRIKARSMVGRMKLTKSDLPDLKQQLSMEVWRRLPKYDPSRGDLQSFLYWVVEKAAASIIEHRTAAIRDPRRVACSLEGAVPSSDGKDARLATFLRETEGHGRLGVDHRHFVERSDMAADISAAMELLPPDLQDLCLRLQKESPSEVSRETGIPRGTVYDAIKRIRARFEEAGLQAYLGRD